MTGGKKSRDTGNREELLRVHASEKAGVHCVKVPLSGAVGGEFGGDLRYHVGGEVLTGENKKRKNGDGFKTLEKWKGSNDFLILRRNHGPALFVMDEALALRMMKALDEYGRSVAMAVVVGDEPCPPNDRTAEVPRV